ncbi:MAG TPA: glycosyltransferase family 4 protein [Candidatus Acidoferrales bacterium]|nr:glycosyltransferase family 4 protein [Candidatus Acidoferrales bacterium]
MSSVVGLFTDVLPLGGVQRASRHVAAVTAKFAADRGMTVRFLSLNDPQGLHPIRIGHLEFSVSGYAGSKFQFIRAAVREAGRNPDLVVALHPHLAPIVSVMKLRSRKFRSIVFTHGVEVWQPLGWTRGRALRSADLVLGPSRDTVKQLIELQQIPCSRVRRLAWGLDPDFESRLASPASPTVPNGFPPNSRAILSVGRWNSAEKYKGADTLISVLPRVLKTMPETSLVLVGDGDHRARLEQLAHDLGVSKNVRFLVGLTPDELFACYAHCEIFALPSKGEGFGLVFLEAMAHGKPVVGGAHGGIPDVVEDGVTGLLVQHGDVDNLAQALESLLSNFGWATEMGVRGKDRVAQKFSFLEFEKQLTANLNRVLTR